MIYLDNAATSLIKPAAVEHAVLHAMRTMASPGRGGHKPAMDAAKTVFACRLAAAELFHMDEPENVVFTFNATHALNIAIVSLVQPGLPVVISGFEHNSVTRPLRAIGADIRVAGERLFDPSDTLERFDKMLNGAGLAVCTHVSNAFGYVLPIVDIAKLCKSKGIPLIIDASQSAGVLDVNMKQLQAAFIAMPGHKSLFGPQGTGLLLCGAEGKPILHGGSGSESILQTMPESMPDRLEAGTHNVCGIAGLLAGIQYVMNSGLNEIQKYEQKLLCRFADHLNDSGYEVFTGKNQCGAISIRRPGMDSETLGELLGAEGICARSGLHCAPLAHRSAGTLETGTVRFSFSPFITARQVDTVCEYLLSV